MFISVCDGHGMYGHDVSGYLRDNLPYALNQEFKRKLGSNYNSNNNYNTNSNSNKAVNKVIEDVFISTNSRLFNEATIDTNFSGSTCVSVIYLGDRLISANVGDSRAVLGRLVNDSKIHNNT